MANKPYTIGGCHSVSKLSTIGHLTLQWLRYNLALVIILYYTCETFDSTELDTVIAYALVSFGFVVMQYDLWVLKKPKYTLKR